MSEPRVRPKFKFKLWHRGNDGKEKMENMKNFSNEKKLETIF